MTPLYNQLNHQQLDHHQLDASFNLIPASTVRKYFICNDRGFTPHARSSAGGTFKFPWFDSETRKEGGFFVNVGKEKYDLDKGRPGVPAKALKHAGMKYRTVKGTMLDGKDILYGYYCKLIKCPSNASF